MEFRIRKLIDAQASNGQISSFQETTTPGMGPPLHAHRNQMEVFHVVKGRHKFRVHDQDVFGEPGDCFLIPAGVPHTFRNVDSQDGVLHFDLLPSGKSDDFFQKLVSSPPPMEKMPEFFREHDIEILGPPID